MKSFDGGPVYAESDFSRIPVEPLNTLSEAIVLLVALYWLTRKERNNFYGIAGVILLLQWAGATLYHALRNSFYYLLLDVLPILLFVLLVIGYSLKDRTGKQRAIQLALVGLAFFCPLILPDSPSSTYLGLSFACAGALAPILIKNKSAIRYLILSQVTFTLAVIARELDNPWNTHFIWHILAGSACHLTLLSIRKAQ